VWRSWSWPKRLGLGLGLGLGKFLKSWSWSWKKSLIYISAMYTAVTWFIVLDVSSEWLLWHMLSHCLDCPCIISVLVDKVFFFTFCDLFSNSWKLLKFHQLWRHFHFCGFSMLTANNFLSRHFLAAYIVCTSRIHKSTEFFILVLQFVLEILQTIKRQKLRTRVIFMA